MRIEDIEVGMEAKAVTKTGEGCSFAAFCRLHPGRVGVVTRMEELDSGSWLVVMANCWFAPEDLIPAKIANQTVDDFKPGMRVKAHRKSVMSENWEVFLHAALDGITHVLFVSQRPFRVCVTCETKAAGNFDFAPTDLEILEPPVTIGSKIDSHSYFVLNKEQKLWLDNHWNIPVPEHTKDALSLWSIHENENLWLDGSWGIPDLVPQEVKGLKPITLKAIIEAGALPSCIAFHAFTQAMVAIRPEYMWEEIPPEVAQKAAEDLEYPVWLEDHGFLNIPTPEPEKPEQPVFDIDKVTLQFYSGNKFLCYDGVPLIRLTEEGAYRCQAVLNTDAGFPVALETSHRGYYQVKMQN
uniref:Uncharacterized protein n=1 Tax=viral metagenome TaxID=1070528 RepID=A0A6M3L796_9ZZZZ